MVELNEINDKTDEGKMLMAAMALITSECRTDKTPNEVLEELTILKNEMYCAEISENKCGKFICGVDYGDGNSQGAFTVFKNGKSHWTTTKAWKVRLYLIWCRIKGIKTLKEAN